MPLSWSAVKDPDEIKDYELDWSPLLVDGDILVSSSWTIISSGSSLVVDSSSFTGTLSSVWFSGGETSLSPIEILNRVETQGGRTYDQTMKLKIKVK